MKRYRLLVDWDVVTRMRKLPARTQRQIYTIFSRLEEAPDLVSEFQETDENGRQLEGFIFEGWAFYFWIDLPDRHVKVLAFQPADDRIR